MICAAYNQLPDNTFLANVVVKRNGEQVIVNKIFNTLDDVYKWQRREIGRQMHGIVMKYINQRDHALMSRSVSEGDCLLKLMASFTNARNVDMDSVAQLIVFHERNLWAIAPHNDSRFAGWIPTLNELVNFSKHILNLKPVHA